MRFIVILVKGFQGFMSEMKNRKIVILEGEIWLPEGVTIIDGRLVIIDGTIAYVGSKSDSSIDEYLGEDIYIREYMRGEKILPGFVEPHCHLGVYEEITGADRLNKKGELIATDYKVIDNINFFDIGFKDAAFSGGVTTACIFPGSGALIGGIGAIIKTIGKDVIKNEYALKLALGENVEKEFKLVRSELKDILFKEFLNSDDPIIKKVVEGKIPVRCHCHLKEDIEVFLELKNRFNLNMVIEHGTEASLVIDNIKESGVSVVAGPFFVGRPKKEMANLDRRLVYKLVAAGIKTSLMSDYPSNPPDMLRYTIVEAVKNGLDESRAFDLITKDSSEILGIYDRVGSLEVGKDGDVVVHSHSPFDPKDKVVDVFIKGELKKWEAI